MSFDAEMQCIACDRKILENAHSCICGHVHAEKRLIRGKRYSAYREQLYSKLVTKQLLGLERKSKASHQSKCPRNYDSHKGVSKVSNQPFKQRKNNSLKSKRRSKHGGKVKHARSTEISAASKDRGNIERYWNNCNFSFALEEINRRLSSQSLFWVRL